ncbi:hypothetical protein [Dipodfec virus UOA04_Rod_999]|nr:hypothetical protein [Dipodfec virus UOA04_Rod_999]
MRPLTSELSERSIRACPSPRVRAFRVYACRHRIPIVFRAVLSLSHWRGVTPCGTLLIFLVFFFGFLFFFISFAENQYISVMTWKQLQSLERRIPPYIPSEYAHKPYPYGYRITFKKPNPRSSTLFDIFTVRFRKFSTLLSRLEKSGLSFVDSVILVLPSPSPEHTTASEFHFIPLSLIRRHLHLELF